MGEIRSSRTDIDALRRLIALRERKPTAPTTPTNAAAAPQPPPARTFPRPVPGHSSNANLLPNSNLRALPAERSLPGEEIAPGLHLIQAHLPLPAPARSLPLAFAKRPDDALDPRRLLFFDTETTGLAGGTGTRAFMIGAADWYHDAQLGDGLRIRQLMISTLSAEPAMLRAFAQWIEPGTVLSSYNGRCYDTPLLNTRYRLARIANPLSGLDHVDLLFPTRRMYRGVWENCRLATMERELLHIVREDDLPGSQAPAAWLHYLRGGSSALLRRVAAHNHQDVVTLAQLMLKLIEAYDERALASV
ncbi:exonuclease [Lysobacter sp. Root690]|nr:exonuclease [Lysobacter sp. Root690]